jgi:hypothetical protein
MRQWLIDMLILTGVALLASLCADWLVDAHGAELAFGPSLDQPRAAKKALHLSYPATPILNLGAGVVTESGATLYADANLGVHVVTPAGLAGRIGFGPALFSRTGDRLSSVFNFHIQARGGLCANGFEVGMQFDHFSNAGLVPPNPGLDLLAFYVGVPL